MSLDDCRGEITKSANGEPAALEERGLARRLMLNRPVQVLIDIGVIGTSFILAYVFRFDGIPPVPMQKQIILFLPYVVVLFVGCNFLFGVNRFMWRYTSLHEAVVISQSVATAQLLLTGVWGLVMANHQSLRIPIGVMLAFPILTYISLLVARGARRVQFNSQRKRRLEEQQAKTNGTKRNSADGASDDPTAAAGPTPCKRLLLIGAGTAGQMLSRDLRDNPRYEVVGFLDDDPGKQKRIVGGHPVLGTTEQLIDVIRDHQVKEIVLAMPSAPRPVVQKILSTINQRKPVRVSSVPSLTEIVQGKVELTRLRPVRTEDLLSRATVEHPADDEKLIKCYEGKRIMVTGAAGSIGSELVRQLSYFQPENLVLLDKDENGLYEIGLEMREDHPTVKISDFVANVRDRDRLSRIFEQVKPQVVFHAAAYKHVPMMEAHPSEAILNNVIGTKNVVETAAAHGVERFVMISTDKAVNPTSIMGASKRVAEMIVRNQALSRVGFEAECVSRLKPTDPSSPPSRYCCVRFGNVLGSRGSVVPIFRKRIEQGKNIRVTDPEVRRYFMTIPEAVQLVIKAGSLGNCGETFVLDMGDPVRIVDLAKEMIEQAGLIPGEDIQIEFTGLRPGEKLYEELLVNQENGARSTEYPKIFVGEPLAKDWEEVRQAIVRLESAARDEDATTICDTLRRLDIGYRLESDVLTEA